MKLHQYNLPSVPDQGIKILPALCCPHPSIHPSFRSDYHLFPIAPPCKLTPPVGLYLSPLHPSLQVRGTRCMRSVPQQQQPTTQIVILAELSLKLKT